PRCRLLDTRGGAPVSSTPRSVPVTGLCGIPNGAIAIAGNLVAVTPSNTGTMTVYPAGTAPLSNPGTTSFRAGNTRATNFVGTLSGGRLNLVATITVDAVLDVNGYFMPGLCIPSGDQTGIQAALVGAGAQAYPCPKAVFNLTAPIHFTATNQGILTLGSPTDSSRATLRIAAATGPDGLPLTTAIIGLDQSGVRIQYI